eukprot:g32166.t1
MAAAAATIGARRGRQRGQAIVVEQELQRKAAENQMKKQQKEMAQSILEAWQCAARLFHKKGGKADCIERGELMSLLRAWGDFMKMKELVHKLTDTFDKDDNKAIDLEELQDILESTHKGPVKKEVTDWVMREADVSRNGTLNHLELARALLAFELLCKGEPHMRKDLSEGIHDGESGERLRKVMGIKQLGKFLKSSCPSAMNSHSPAAEYKDAHIAGLLRRSIRLLELGIKPIFIFDGEAPMMKSHVLQQREKNRAKSRELLEEAQAMGDQEAMKRYGARPNC